MWDAFCTPVTVILLLWLTKGTSGRPSKASPITFTDRGGVQTLQRSGSEAVSTDYTKSINRGSYLQDDTNSFTYDEQFNKYSLDAISNDNNDDQPFRLSGHTSIQSDRRFMTARNYDKLRLVNRSSIPKRHRSERDANVIIENQGDGIPSVDSAESHTGGRTRIDPADARVLQQRSSHELTPTSEIGVVPHVNQAEVMSNENQSGTVLNGNQATVVSSSEQANVVVNFENKNNGHEVHVYLHTSISPHAFLPPVVNVQHIITQRSDLNNQEAHGNVATDTDKTTELLPFLEIRPTATMTNHVSLTSMTAHFHTIQPSVPTLLFRRTHSPSASIGKSVSTLYSTHHILHSSVVIQSTTLPPGISEGTFSFTAVKLDAPSSESMRAAVSLTKHEASGQHPSIYPSSVVFHSQLAQDLTPQFGEWQFESETISSSHLKLPATFPTIKKMNADYNSEERLFLPSTDDKTTTSTNGFLSPSEIGAYNMLTNSVSPDRFVTRAPFSSTESPPSPSDQAFVKTRSLLASSTTVVIETLPSNLSHIHLLAVPVQQKATVTPRDIREPANIFPENTTNQTSALSGDNAIINAEVTVKPTSLDSTSTVDQGAGPATGTPPSYMKLTFRMSRHEFCVQEITIREELVQIIHTQNQEVETADQIRVVNDEQQNCSRTDDKEILVDIYLTNKTFQFDRQLTVSCADILKSNFPFLERKNFTIKNKLLAIILVDEDDEYAKNRLNVSSPVTDQDDSSDSSYYRVTIAVVLAVVGGSCCVGLIVLQIIVRRRNKANRFPPPVSPSNGETISDSIQLTSVLKSRPNSGLYNPGLDLVNPLDPSHPLTYAQLSKFCMDAIRIAEEYQKVPQRMPRPSMVPVGDEDKNRYANILPLVRTRVKLLQDGSRPKSTYINANFVTGPENQCQYYIATQAPTETTTSDFWTMVWQQGCKVIVMLTQIEEQGQSKCASYWPELVGKSAAHKYGDFQIELKQKEVHQEYIVSTLEINNLRKIEKRQLDHYWYTCWPPNGMPEPISLVKLVLDVRPKYENGYTPMVVHCSPGTGRTCTFIALDLCMRQFETRRIVDVMKTVFDMRQERAGAIQNKEQYALLYNAVNEYATIVMTPGITTTSSVSTLQALLSN